MPAARMVPDARAQRAREAGAGPTGVVRRRMFRIVADVAGLVHHRKELRVVLHLVALAAGAHEVRPGLTWTRQVRTLLQSRVNLEMTGVKSWTTATRGKCARYY